MLRIEYNWSNCGSKKASQEAVTVSQARSDDGLDHGSHSTGDEK